MIYDSILALLSLPPSLSLYLADVVRNVPIKAGKILGSDLHSTRQNLERAWKWRKSYLYYHIEMYKMKNLSLFFVASPIRQRIFACEIKEWVYIWCWAFVTSISRMKRGRGGIKREKCRVLRGEQSAIDMYKYYMTDMRDIMEMIFLISFVGWVDRERMFLRTEGLLYW